MIDKYLRHIFVGFCFFIHLNVCAQSHQNLIDTGYATFYAKRFENRKTSNGDVFSNNKHTCAHRTLPFGTKVLVTRLDNEKTTVVIVNDRGPHVKKNLIDLSQAAARDLEMISLGRVRVRIEVLPE